MIKNAPPEESGFRKFLRTIWHNKWLIIFFVLGAGGGVALGYYTRGYTGLFALGIGSLTGLIGHVLDDMGSSR